MYIIPWNISNIIIYILVLKSSIEIKSLILINVGYKNTHTNRKFIPNDVVH